MSLSNLGTLELQTLESCVFQILKRNCQNHFLNSCMELTKLMLGIINSDGKVCQISKSHMHVIFWLCLSVTSLFLVILCMKVFSVLFHKVLSTCLLVCLFLWTPSFEGNWVSLMGFSLTSGAGVDGNAPYQAQELQITTLANPGIQTNFLPPRPVQS